MTIQIRVTRIIRGEKANIACYSGHVQDKIIPMNIYTLDLNFQGIPETIASYLIMAPEGPVLVESGPASTQENLRAQLAAHGFAISDVKHVLLTHIHLDHAGAAGWLAQQGAQLYVHHVGAPHLVDPSKLLASAGRIYGDKMDTLWGQTLPAPADKVVPVADGDVLDVAGLQFTALDTPGHAWHHHVYRLGDLAFTGDAAGVRLVGTQIIDLPAPPPEFKLEVWLNTLDRLQAENFAVIYPTHFGRIEDVAWQLDALRELLLDATEYIREGMDVGKERDKIVADYAAWIQARARAHGASDFQLQQYETANPSYMSVDGIIRYWQRKQTK